MKALSFPLVVISMLKLAYLTLTVSYLSSLLNEYTNSEHHKVNIVIGYWLWVKDVSVSGSLIGKVTPLDNDPTKGPLERVVFSDDRNHVLLAQSETYHITAHITHGTHTQTSSPSFLGIRVCDWESFFFLFFLFLFFFLDHLCVFLLSLLYHLKIHYFYILPISFFCSIQHPPSSPFWANKN